MTRGERIKEMRKEKGISQTELARRIGVSKQTLYKYENDIVTNIPNDKMEYMAAVLRTHAAYLQGYWTKEEAMQTVRLQDLISIYDSLSDAKQAQLFGYAQALQEA